ncbi:hypothetical protein AB8P51_02775 [Muriicola sp. SD30]|uniref:hypothetical protein n=1 Tax=Muriicola sp. SD30 TaxID=3240936 RepID=UPI0035105E55
MALVDNGDGTYDFTDAAGNVTTITDTSISTLTDNGDGSFTYTDETGAVTIFTETLTTLVDNFDGTITYTNEDGVAQIVSKSDIIDNFDGTYVFNNNDGTPVTIDSRAVSNPYDNTTSGLIATDVQAAIDEINAAAGTVALVDNADGTYTFTDAGGNVTTISDTSISTMVDNLDGTYTYTDETGATQLIDTNASSNPYDNTVSGLVATDVQAAIDEINAAAGTVALVDNADGTYTFTDAGGNVTTISDTSISTMVDNLDGTYTYTDETGAIQLIDTNASSNPYDNTVSGLVATDVQAAIDEINAAAGTVALVDNADGTYTFTDAGGNVTTISDTSISTMVDNLDGTYTYTDETGATQVINTTASSNPYDNTVSGLVATDVQAAIDEINAAAGTVALVDNGDGTYDFTDAAGNVTTITDTSISTLTDNGDGSFTYTDETGAVTIFTETLTTLVDNFDGTITYTNEDGVAQIVSKSDIIDNFDGTYVFNNNDGTPVTIDSRAVSNPYDNTTSGLIATDVQAAIDEINAAAGTVALVDNADGTYTFTDAGGNVTTISDTSISTMVDNLDGTYTYTDETGATQLIDTNASSNPYDNTVSGLVATDVQAAIDEINAAAGTVALVDNADGTYTFTDAGGNVTTISDTSISTMVDNLDGTYTYTDETGATQVINTTASSNPYDNTTSGLVATDVQAAIDEINAAAGTVALVDNADGTYTFTDAGGNVTTISDTSISTMVDNLDGTYTYTDETGATQVINTNASSNPYDNTTSGLVATDVQAAIDEINAAAGTVALVDNADGTYTFTDAGGNVTTISDTSISTMVDNFDGTYTYTDETGATQLINTNASSNPYDNTVSGLVATDVQAAIDEINALAGTVALVDNADGTYTFTDAAGNITTISDTSISTLVDNGNATFTYTDETGTTVTINMISADANNDIIAGSDGGLYLNVASVAVGETITNIVDNGDGTFTYTNENGTPQIISKADVTDNADGTYTFDNNDGTPVTINTNAGSNPYDNTTSGLTATDVQAAIDEVSAGSTDDQNISGSGLAGTNLTIGIENGASEIVDLSSLVGTDDQNISGSGLAGTNLTIGIENGASEIVDLSSLVGTDDQTAAEVNYDNTTSGLTAVDVQAAIDEVAAGSTDDQNISGSGLAGTNLTIAIENGASEVVDLSSLVGTDDQIANEVNITDAGGNFTATEVEGALAELAAGSTDDQNISGSGLAGTNLTIGIENGASEVVDLSSLVGTDDQTAAEVTYDNTTSGLTAVDVQAAIDEVAAGSTDDQNISGSGLAGTNLTIGIENGAAEVVDLSSLVGTDDQNLSTDSTPGNISIEDGNTLTLNVDDADADATNEYNTGVGMNAGALEVTDAGGTLSTSLISTDANNDISSGTDGALYLNVASVTISETITNIVDNADGTFTYTNENGTPQTISKADVTDNADGTYTFDNNDGTPVTINTNAGSNPYDNTTSGLTATDVQAALDEVAAGSTDDQNISGSGLAGTNLTIGIENGASEVVDLSSLVGTDDQIASEVNITDAGGNFTATEVEGALAELAAGSTDDQNISGSGLAGTNLTIGIENGASEVVDLSSLVGTDDQTAAEVTYDNTTSGLTAVDVQAAIDEVAAGSSDDQNISGSGLAGNILTIGIENGTNETVDLSALVGTDDQIANEVNITDAGGNFTATEVEGALAELAAGSTDDQNLTGATLSGANILQIDIENGTSTTVDLSALDNSGTDDQTAAEVTYDNTTSGLTAVDVQAAIDEVAAGSTDDQNISGSGLAGTNLTIGIENGASEVVDLSTLVGTDDQTLSTDSTPGNISIEDGNTLTLNVDDADADPTNEYNTGVAMNAGALEVTDAGGTFSDSLISTDANNDISAGSDGALYLNVASVTISETITNIVDNADGTFTYTNENGVPQTISKADVTDNADGTYTFDNNDGSPVTISTTAGSNPYDNTTSGLTATDVQAALDEVAAGSTDDQNISGSGLAGTNLTIGIENGTSEVVDLSALVGTDDQIASEVNITDASGNFTSTEVEGALAELAAGSTDDQNISGSGLAGTNLTIGIENGTSEVVDLSSLVGTDDQNISGSGLAGNILTIGIENGTNETVDLTALVGTDDQIANEVNITDAGGNFTSTEVEGALAELAAGSTDDQNISGSGLAGNILTIGIENGTNETVDLSALVGTDDQIANEVNITDAGGNFTSTEVEGALAELAAGSTDDQNLTGASLSGANILQIDIENGTSTTVDLSSLDDSGTDDQTAAEVTYDNTTSGLTAVDVQAAIDEVAAGSTDDQNISGSGLAGNILTIGIENGTDETVDLSALVGTDDQNLTGATLSGANVLQIDIENGTSTTVDLSALDNSGTDDQTAAEVTYDNTTSGLSAVDVQAAIDEVAAGSTDDQNISGSGLAGNILTIGIENGTNETVDLSALVGTDDQIANEVNITDAGGNFTSTEVEGALAELAAGSTDDQNLTGATLSGANVLQIDIENGTSTTVDLSSLDNSGTDDQTAAEVTYDNTTSGLTAVDVQAALDEVAAGSTDDQNISGSGLAGNILTIGIENGTNETVDLSALVGTDDQIANEVNITDAGGNFTSTEVEGALAELAAGSTDDQNISGSGLAGNILTIGIENGTNETVDLSALVGTDDQIASEVNITDAGGNFTSTEVEGALAELAAGSTDDQNISGSGLAGNILTIGIENGTNETVDLSALVGTDDQNLTGASLSGANILQIDIENGTSTTVDLSSLDNSGTDDQTAAEVTYDNTTSGLTAVDVQAALDEVAAGSTDDQNISGSGLAGNILTIGIENGTNETVDLSALVGTDDQIANEVNITDAGGNFTSTEVEGALAELAAGSTDDQNISGSGLAGTNLTIGIENGTSEVVDLSSLVGTDDQNISGSGLAGNILTIGIENGTNETVDLSALVGTDDQIANEVNITDAGGNFVSTEVEGALAELAAGSTDDQNISGSGLAGNILTIGIENGTNETVDLSALVGTDDQNIESLGVDAVTNILTVGIEDGTSQTVDLSHLDDSGTDDQNISGSGLAGNILTIGIENGTNETVDLSALVGTDDQIANEVNITDAGGNFTSTEVEGALAELAAGSTDDQNISGSGLAGNILTIGIENGTNETVDLSALVGTDDQIANEVNITDAGGNFTSTEVEGALAELAAGSTDDQNISGSGLAGNILTIGIENGTNETVDLSALVGTDDQIASEVNITDAGGNFTSTEVEGALAELAAGSTDDQNISGSGLAGNILTIGIENGTNETVDLSALVGTDDQIASEVNITDAGGNFTSTEVEGALAELAAGSTDDQNISGSGLAGNILTIGIENGTNETVDLSALVGTDDQNLTGATLSGANILQIDIENGASTTVDLSALDNSGTDDQTAAEVTYDNTTSGLTAVDVQAAIDEVAAASTDDQYDDEVPLRTPIDVDEGGVGSPTNETNVQEVINAIAPITSKAARIFYPPSIAVDASTNGSFSIDLYAQYTAQFGTPTVASAGAPAAVPTYGATELYYYVTYADPTVFNTATMSIDANGVLSYDIIGQPTDYNSLINVVFVVK